MPMKISLGVFARILRKWEAQEVVMREIIAGLLALNATQRKEILELLAGDAALQEKAQAAFAKAEALEAKARAGLPEHP